MNSPQNVIGNCDRPQQRLYREISGPRGNVGGPFALWLRLPPVADAANAFGNALRLDGKLERRIFELVVLIVARHWGAQYEWFVHEPAAIKAGLAHEVAAALRDGLEPTYARDDERIAAALVPHRLWIILDEWSNLPLDLQPYLADLIRRTLFHLSGVTVKIAAIEFRSRFAIPEPNNTYIGVEVGADMSAGANLDDIMVFDNDVERASAFHRQLIYNHLKESGLFAEDTVRDAKELVRLTFTQDNAFSELVRAAEGVPRDAIHILSLAAQYSGNERISIPTVRKAAKNWYQTGKANNLRSREAANQLLEWIKEKVIQHRKARAFLLKSQTSHPLIDELFDARVIHLIKRGVSSNETPGVRYDVYKLDYGCYVDLMSTGSAPLGLFEVEEAVGASSYYSAARKSLK